MMWRVVYQDGSTQEGLGRPDRNGIVAVGAVACAVFEHPDYPANHILVVQRNDYYYWDEVNSLWCGSDNEGEMLRLAIRGTCVLESAPTLPTERFNELIEKVKHASRPS